MVAITRRADLSRGLTNDEIDANMTNLKTAAEAAALSASWSGVTGKPTTVAGYGITDAQAPLVSGTNIKTVNGQPVLGAGDLALAPASHNHDAAYLGKTAKAADSDLLDGFNSTAFLRSVNGVTPDGSGNVAVDLTSRVAKSGDTMTGDLVMSGSAIIKSSRPGDDARNTGFKMADGQDLGEMNRWSQYYDDRASNCNGYLPNGNCAGNAVWNPPNGNWWTWGVSGVPTGNCANYGAYDGRGGFSQSFNPVSVAYNYDGYYLAADEIGGSENRRNYRNCNCGAFNCRTNCNCNCDCNCTCK